MSLYTYNKEGALRCPDCGRARLRLRYGKIRFHFAHGTVPCGGGTVTGLTAEDLRGGVHPTTCGCRVAEEAGTRRRQVAR